MSDENKNKTQDPFGKEAHLKDETNYLKNFRVRTNSIDNYLDEERRRESERSNGDGGRGQK